MKKIFSLSSLLYLTLILALFSSLEHVAFAFSTVNGGSMFTGYVTGIAIDLGLLALAASINQRKKESKRTKMLWIGVGIFSIISTYANYLAGITFLSPMNVQTGPIGQWLISIRPIALSAILPSLVIFMSEVLAGDYQANVAKEQAKVKRLATKAKKATKAPKKADWIPTKEVMANV